MKTEQLIAALAADALPVNASDTDRRFMLRLMVGLVAAVIGMQLFLGARPDLAAAAVLPMFWIKLAFPAALALAAAIGLWRLGHPGMRLGRIPVVAALPVALIWAMAGQALAAAGAGERITIVMGTTWLECLIGITVLSVPALWIALRAVRALAPTRPALAGAWAGLFAGSVAAFAYALHCPELQAPFLAVWYLAGMLVPALAGAVLGRQLLHW